MCVGEGLGRATAECVPNMMIIAVQNKYRAKFKYKDQQLHNIQTGHITQSLFRNISSAKQSGPSGDFSLVVHAHENWSREDIDVSAACLRTGNLVGDRCSHSCSRRCTGRHRHGPGEHLPRSQLLPSAHQQRATLQDNRTLTARFWSGATNGE